MGLKICITLVATMSAACLLCGCAGASSQTNEVSLQESENVMPSEEVDAVGLVMDIATTQYFTDDAVSEDDIEKILLAGSNAPSAMNGQPWHFSVITDETVLQQIADGMSFGWYGRYFSR